MNDHVQSQVYMAREAGGVDLKATQSYPGLLGVQVPMLDTQTN